MKKIIWLFTLWVLTAMLLSSCSSKQEWSLSEEKAYRLNTSVADEDGESNHNSPQNLMENKKIIKNARLDIEASDAKDTYDKIIGWALQSGGYEFSKNLNVRGGYNVIDAQIKISPDKLDSFIDFIGECADIINCSVSAEDITDSYFDTDIRLKSTRASLDSYYKLLENAGTVSEILEIKRTIDEITAQIEAMQGRLNLWDRQVSESTVSLSIHEKNDPVKVGKQVDLSALSFSDMGFIMRNGFFTVWNIIVAVVQWLIIIFVSLIPLIIIAGIIFFIIWYAIRKKK